MWNLDYSSVSSIKEILLSNSLVMTKKRGQNFLINNNARESIASFILDDVKKDEEVWEIGPGLGSITTLLCNKCKLKVFELDHGFVRVLKDAFTSDELEIIEGDALKTVFKEEKCPSVLSGNLPYNVGTVLIASILENGVAKNTELSLTNFPKKMVFTLQKEVADRLCGKEKDLSSLSALAMLLYNCEIKRELPSMFFYPSPLVKSSVVVMIRKEKPEVPFNQYKEFISFNREVFKNKRKTLFNNLKDRYKNSKDIIANSNIDVNTRAENLTFEQLINLWNSLSF